MSGDLDAARLAAVISPLRRALLAATRAEARLPELSDSQIDVIRALHEGRREVRPRSRAVCG